MIQASKVFDLTKDIDLIEQDFKSLVIEVAAESTVSAQVAVAAFVLNGVVDKTPVDFGIARAGWTVGIGTAIDKLPSTGDVDSPPQSKTYLTGISELKRAKPFGVVFITNSVPHILVLDQGLYDPGNPDDSSAARVARAKRRDKRGRDRATKKLGHPGATWVHDGHSIQAPLGMVDLTLEDLRNLP